MNYTDQQRIKIHLRQFHNLIASTLGKNCKEDLSNSTKSGYFRLARKLIGRAGNVGPGLIDIVRNTKSKNTYRKRVAALCYFALRQNEDLMATFQDFNGKDLHKLRPKAEELASLATSVNSLRTLGPEGKFNARKSKRKALRGLPDNWRHLLYQRGSYGKYSSALLILSLTGCRPSELVNGVGVSRIYDPDKQAEVICFDIKGSKVKSTQGQPFRTITYLADSTNPLVSIINERLETGGDDTPYLHVAISSAINLTTEIRRLAKSLWPKHKHSITAYCYRHQFASDLKAMGNGDFVSQGLGHCSEKTRRRYGTARQASKSSASNPINIETLRPIKKITPKSPTNDAYPSP